MPTTKLTSRELNQDAGRAKRPARAGPVIVTERGRPAHVLVTCDDYRRLVDAQGSIIDRLGSPAGVEGIELDAAPLRDPPRPADLG
jgi:prevent-host-death family protein